MLCRGHYVTCLWGWWHHSAPCWLCSWYHHSATWLLILTCWYDGLLSGWHGSTSWPHRGHLSPQWTYFDFDDDLPRGCWDCPDYASLPGSLGMSWWRSWGLCAWEDLKNSLRAYLKASRKSLTFHQRVQERFTSIVFLVRGHTCSNNGVLTWISPLYGAVYSPTQRCICFVFYLSCDDV